MGEEYIFRISEFNDSQFNVLFFEGKLTNRIFVLCLKFRKGGIEEYTFVKVINEREIEDMDVFSYWGLNFL